MRRISEVITYVPAVLLAIALVSTVAEWRSLMEVGGWFALLGHFLMVSATLVLLYLAGVLVLILAVLPFIMLIGQNEDHFFALAEAQRAGLPSLARQFFTRPLIGGANLLLKAAWYCWWFVRGSPAHERSR